VISNIQRNPATAASLHNLASNASVTVIDKRQSRTTKKKKEEKNACSIRATFAAETKSTCCIEGFLCSFDTYLVLVAADEIVVEVGEALDDAVNVIFCGKEGGSEVECVLLLAKAGARDNTDTSLIKQ